MSRKITQMNNKRYKKKYDNMLKKMSHFKIILLHMMCIIPRYQFEFILKQQYSSHIVFFNPTCKKGFCRKRSAFLSMNTGIQLFFMNIELLSKQWCEDIFGQNIREVTLIPARISYISLHLLKWRKLLTSYIIFNCTLHKESLSD